MTRKQTLRLVFYVKDYTGNYIYKNNQLQFFNTAEGYVEPDGNTWKYIYQYKDHLGNIRLSYADSNNDGSIDVVRNATDVDGDGDLAMEIREEKNYYPFGLRHKGYNDLARGRKNNHQTYLGQEFNEELGLNWHSYKWRNADPALGRFFGSDPIAEDYYYQTNYQFASNNPVWKIEVEGLEGRKTNNGTDLTDGGSPPPPSDLQVGLALVDQNSSGAGWFKRQFAKAMLFTLSTLNFVGSGGQESFGEINPQSVETGIDVTRAELTAQTTFKAGSKIKLPKKSKSSTPKVSSTPSSDTNTGKIYKVLGEDTSTGLPYVGRTKQSSPSKRGRGANDGRDRSKAEIIDTYDPSNGKEGSYKEQKAIDANGGVQNLDNKRNEMSKQNYKEAEKKYGSGN